MFMEASILLNGYINIWYVVNINSTAILATVCNIPVCISNS